MTDKSLRVIHVSSASRMIYGAVQSMMTLASVQRSQGDHVSFVSFKGKSFGPELRQMGYDTREVRVRTKLDPFAIMEMRRHFLAQRADIVHTHLSTSSVNGCLAARLAKVPCVASVHGMSGKLSFIFADHMIGVSKGVKAHLVAQGISEDRITAVYNGVDLPQGLPTKAQSREQFGIPPNAFVFGTVARLTELKGVEYAIQAFAEIASKMPNAVYALVGDGDGAEGYRAQVASLGLTDRVFFLGYQAPVFAPLAAMDVFLFPSLKEAMGIAVVEALAMGLPVVSTDVGGLPEVITPDVGFLVPPKSSQAMATAAFNLASNEDRLAQYSAAAGQRAKDVFSVDAMLRGTESVYRLLLDKSVLK